LTAAAILETVDTRIKITYCKMGNQQSNVYKPAKPIFNRGGHAEAIQTLNNLQTECRNGFPVIHSDDPYFLDSTALQGVLGDSCDIVKDFHPTSSAASDLHYTSDSQGRVHQIGSLESDITDEQNVVIRNILGENLPVKNNKTYISKPLGDLAGGPFRKKEALAIFVDGNKNVFAHLGLLTGSADTSEGLSFVSCGSRKKFSDIRPLQVAILKTMPHGMARCKKNLAAPGYELTHSISNEHATSMAGKRQELANRQHKIEAHCKSKELIHAVTEATEALKSNSISEIQMTLKLLEKSFALAEGNYGKAKPDKECTSQMSNFIEHMKSTTCFQRINYLREQENKEPLVEGGSNDENISIMQRASANDTSKHKSKSDNILHKCILSMGGSSKLTGARSLVDNACENVTGVKDALEHLHDSHKDNKLQAIEILKKIINTNKQHENVDDSENCLSQLGAYELRLHSEHCLKLLNGKVGESPVDTANRFLLNMSKMKSPPQFTCDHASCLFDIDNKNNVSKAEPILETFIARTKSDSNSLKQKCSKLQKFTAEALADPTGQSKAWNVLVDEVNKNPDTECELELAKYINTADRESCRHRLSCSLTGKFAENHTPQSDDQLNKLRREDDIDFLMGESCNLNRE
jgi:hypothetical protein